MNRLITILFLILFSCTHKFQKKLNTIDSLIASLEQCSKYFASIDTSIINKYNRIYKKTEKFFQKEFKDTLKKNESILLEKYYIFYKNIKKYPIKKYEYNRDISFSLHQLKTLRHDIYEKVLPKDSADIFLKEEKNIALQEIEEVNNYTNLLKKSFKKLDSLQSKIDSLIIELRKNEIN